MDSSTQLKQLTTLLDHTRLKEYDDRSGMMAWYQQINEMQCKPQAICVYPQYLNLANQILAAPRPKLATVINFPSGQLSREDIKSEVHQAQDNSAEELDVVVPYKQWLAGDQRIEEFTDWFRSICGGSVIFKTIIESGQLPSEKHVQMAASEAIAGGADFVKTSTGKTKPAVTMISARVILETIKQHNSAAGLKVAGGINDWVTAESYVELAETIMTKYWVTPNKLRIGASKLLTI